MRALTVLFVLSLGAVGAGLIVALLRALDMDQPHERVTSKDRRR